MISQIILFRTTKLPNHAAKLNTYIVNDVMQNVLYSTGSGDTVNLFMAVFVRDVMVQISQVGMLGNFTINNFVERAKTPMIKIHQDMCVSHYEHNSSIYVFWLSLGDYHLDEMQLFTSVDWEKNQGEILEEDESIGVVSFGGFTPTLEKEEDPVELDDIWTTALGDDNDD